MQVVIQKDETGCGLACVAMLADTGYGEVRQAAAALGIRPDDPALWSDTGPVRRLLDHYGIRAAPEETPFTGWGGLPDRALLATKHHYEGDRPCWHWCLFVRGPGGPVVLDPAASLAENRRTDWAAMAPAWSIGLPEAPA